MSYYTSLTGMRNAQTELNTISNNLANAETTGFKKSTVNFSDIVAGSSFTNAKTQVGIGSLTQSIDQNFSIGSVKDTGSALDLMVNGNGFFTVTNPENGQVLYTRNGNFHTDGTGGAILDAYGNNLQIMAYDSSTGTYAASPSNATIPATSTSGNGSYVDVQVADDGTITASYSDATNIIIGKVTLANFASPSGLLQQGNQEWTVTGVSGAPIYGTPNDGAHGKLISGALEQSNVETAEEMVNLITAQRYFQANAKAIDAFTQISDSVINLRS
jgi:flagellar hook protein FlgE